MEKPKKRPFWHYLVFIFGIITFIGVLIPDEEKVPTKEKITLKTNVRFKLITNREDIRQGVKLNDGTQGVFLNRAYAYFVSNFDKSNPLCWVDLESFGKEVATPGAPYNTSNSLIFVYFLTETEDSAFIPYGDPLSTWDITWKTADDPEDSLFIANYLYGPYGDKLVRHIK